LGDGESDGKKVQQLGVDNRSWKSFAEGRGETTESRSGGRVDRSAVTRKKSPRRGRLTQRGKEVK